MSLATRCTACGTVFRVVQDQLQVSEGWVRCGRCDAVFNALEGLFDLGRQAPPDWDEDASVDPSGASLAIAGRPGAPGEPQPEPEPPGDRRPPVARELPAEREAASTSAPAARSAGGLDELFADPRDAHIFRKRRSEGAKPPSVQVGARDRLEFSDAKFDSDLFAEHSAADEPADHDAQASGPGDLPLENANQPDFLRRAERRARWRSAPAQTTLAVGSLFAALVLAVQAGHHHRDALTADWPAARPLLSAWCEVNGCSIAPPRRIDDVSVESTSLARATGSDGFVLSVTLKSRSAIALALPSVDLSLTDGNGRLVARRALSPQDFGARGVIAPRAEAPLQLMLSTGGARVAGYTVEIFYP